VHFWDETVYLQNAEVICCGKHNYSELSSRPPLLSLLYAGSFLLWHHDYIASLLVAGLNALGPLFLFWAGKRLAGRTAGGLSALLLAFSPFFAKTGNSLLTDNPALTLILISFCLLLKGLATDKQPWFALAGFLTALAGLMRFTSLITVFVFPLYLVWPRKRWESAGLFALGVALGFGPYLLWSRFKYGSLLFTLQEARRNVGGSIEPWSFYIHNFGTIFPWLSLAGVGLWVVAWLLYGSDTPTRGAAQSAPSQGSGEIVPRAASDLTLVWWVLIVLTYFSALPHKELRYLIPLAAPWFLLSGRGLAVLTTGQSKLKYAAGIAILGLTLGYSFAPIVTKFKSPLIEPYISEEKRAADYLNEVDAKRPGALYLNYNYPVFAYYTNLPIRILVEEGMDFYRDFPGNMPSDGYLILYKDLQKEPRPIWADVNPHFRRLREYPSLVVYEYWRSKAD
jgi:4-amino-4-deoxy-L-arabinose transferase-like glycosyltransferase